MTTNEFISELVKKFPALKPVLDEHILDYDEILSHLFMADVCRFTVSMVQGSEQDRAQLKQILSYLNQCYRNGDEPLQNLICVSFLENLPEPDEHGAEILNLLKYDLAREYRYMREWKPNSFVIADVQHYLGRDYVLVPAGISKKSELLQLLSDKLSFPEYFGHNWDALADCLSDLSWLPAGMILLVHEDIPLGGSNESANYLSVMNCVAGLRDDARLRVSFPIRYKSAVQALLNGSALTKDQSILDLIAQLRLEARNWSIRDYWDSDHLSVGISNSSRNRLVYVSTSVESDVRFYFRLERGIGDAAKTVGGADDVDFETLEAAMRAFLDHDALP